MSESLISLQHELVDLIMIVIVSEQVYYLKSIAKYRDVNEQRHEVVDVLSKG